MGGTTLQVTNTLAHYSGKWIDIYGVKGFSISTGGCDNIDGTVITIGSSTGDVVGVDIEGDGIGSPTSGHGISVATSQVKISGCRISGYGSAYDYSPLYFSGDCIGSIVQANLFDTTVGNVDVKLSADADGILISNNVMSVTATYGVYNYANRNSTIVEYNKNWQTTCLIKGSVANGGWIAYPFALKIAPTIILLSVQSGSVAYNVQPIQANTTHVQVKVWNIATNSSELVAQSIAGVVTYKP